MKSNSKEAVPSLISRLLYSQSLDERRDAAINLCKVIDKEAIPALIKGLGDHEDVAIFCVLALVQIGDDTLPFLLDSLKSDNEQVRGFSAEIIGELRLDDALDDLFHVVINDGSRWVKSRAIEAIERFKNEKAIEFLISLLDDNDSWLMVYSSLALNRLGYNDKNLSALLLERLVSRNEEDRPIFGWGLVEIADKSQYQNLENLIEYSKDINLQKTLEEIIREIKNR
jgi:HEAT repeat protein